MASPHRTPDALIAAQRLAAAAVTAAERARCREVIRRIARDLRDATHQCRPEDMASPILHELAIEIAALLPGLPQDVADLRVFARVSLAECADVLQADRHEVAARWRRTKARLFEKLRQRLPRPFRNPFSLPPEPLPPGPLPPDRG